MRGRAAASSQGPLERPVHRSKQVGTGSSMSPHQPPDCNNHTRFGGPGMASGPPNPRGPPDFQVFFKNKEGNSTVLKILTKEDELEARGPCGPPAWTTGPDPGPSALVGAGLTSRSTCARRKRKAVLHSVSHPRTKRGVRVSPSLAGHTTSDLGAGVGEGSAGSCVPKGGRFPEGGQSRNTAMAVGEFSGSPVSPSSGEGQKQGWQSFHANQRGDGGRTWPWSD